MSKIALSGDASGTGTFTLASPNSSTDRTLTLPDESGTVLTSASAVAASQITSALNATGSAPIYACRAWVNFNGTGTVAIRASGNVSSITDNGTGRYSINFTTAMPDADYCFAGQSRGASGVSYGNTVGYDSQTVQNTSTVSIGVSLGSTLQDTGHITVAIFR